MYGRRNLGRRSRTREIRARDLVSGDVEVKRRGEARSSCARKVGIRGGQWRERGFRRSCRKDITYLFRWVLCDGREEGGADAPEEVLTREAFIYAKEISGQQFVVLQKGNQLRSGGAIECSELWTCIQDEFRDLIKWKLVGLAFSYPGRS